MCCTLIHTEQFGCTYLQSRNLICIAQSWWRGLESIVREVKCCEPSELEHIQWKTGQLIIGEKTVRTKAEYRLICTHIYMSTTQHRV